MALDYNYLTKCNTAHLTQSPTEICLKVLCPGEVREVRL